MIESVQFGIHIEEDVSLNTLPMNTMPVSIEIIPHKAVMINDISEIVRPNRPNRLSNLSNRYDIILNECKKFIFIVFSFTLVIAIVCFLFLVPSNNIKN
jgi:hypothetical protein